MARPIVTTAGQLAVNEALPEELRDYAGLKLDKAGISKLMSRLAVEHPEQYREVSHKLNQLGNNTAYFSGANSFSLKSLARSQQSKDLREQMELELDRTLADDSLDDKQRNEQILSRIGKYREKQTSGIYDESVAERNPLAMQIVSGARGNKANLVSLRGGDLFYTDHRDRDIPVPVFSSYSEGLSPADFYAGSFGARKGVVDGKLSVMNSGFLSKMASQATHRLVVTDEDDDTDREEGSALRGMPVAVDDMDSVGSLLARPVMGYARNTVLTPAILNKLKDKGFDEILVRSPTVGGSRDGGVFARDIGYREYGRLPTRGEFVGLVAAQAAGEPLAQGGLCLAANTMVRTARGTAKRICELKVGDWVVGCDKAGNLTHVRVLNVYRNGLKPCVTTTFKYQHEIPTQVELTSTEDHKLLAVNGEFRPVETTISEFGPTFMAIIPVRGVKGHLPDNREVSGMPGYLSQLHEHPKLFVAPRVSTTSAGEIDTWDIEVDHPDHLFLLENGLVVSNSSKHCLAAGTEVRLPNGEMIHIEQLKPGDEILGADSAGNTFPVQVTHVFDNGLQPCLELKFYGGANVTCTAKHKILFQATTVSPSPGRMIVAGEVSQYDAASPHGCKLLSRRSVGEYHTYDIRVDHPDHLFVLAGGLIVSNSGGVAGAGTTASGFEYIQSLIQIPKTFHGMATHAQRDGLVTAVEKAPAGGFTVTVDGEQHHVRPDNKLLVKRGDHLEAGDLLSDGIPSPAEFVKHKGIGEGRQQFVQAIRAAYKSGGFNIHRRNAELLGRGLIDHVRLDEDVEGFNQNDVVSYSTLERDWKPRDGALSTAIGASKGMYLERPVLHYSLGTQLKPSVIAKLKKHGISDVVANNEPLPFTPEMIRAQDNLHYDQDWMTRLYGSGLKSSLLDAAHKGLASDPDGTSFVPSIASSVDFGKGKYIQSVPRPESAFLGQQTGKLPTSVPHGTAGFGGSSLLQPAKWEPVKQADEQLTTFKDYDSDQFGQGGYKTTGLSSTPKPTTGQGFGGFSGMQPAANKAMGQIGNAAQQVGDAASSSMGWGGMAMTGLSLLTAAPMAVAGGKAMAPAARWAYNNSGASKAVNTVRQGATSASSYLKGGTKAVTQPLMNTAANAANTVRGGLSTAATTGSKALGVVGKASRLAGSAARIGGLPLAAGIGAAEMAFNQQGLKAQDAADSIAMSRGGMGYADMAGRNLTDWSGSSGMGRLMNTTAGLASSTGSNAYQSLNSQSLTNQATEAKRLRDSMQAAQHQARQRSPQAPTTLEQLQQDPDALRLRNDAIRRRWDEIKQLNQKKSWLPWSQ